MSMVTRVVTMVTYRQKLPHIKSHHSFIRQIRMFCEVKRHIKCVIYPLLNGLWQPNQCWLWLSMKRSQTTDSYWVSPITFWLRYQCEVIWQIKKVISPFSPDLWSLNMTGFWLHGVGSERRSLSCHQLLVPVYFFFPVSII